MHDYVTTLSFKVSLSSTLIATVALLIIVVVVTVIVVVGVVVIVAVVVVGVVVIVAVVVVAVVVVVVVIVAVVVVSVVVIVAVVVIGVVVVGNCKSASTVYGKMANPFEIIAPRSTLKLPFVLNNITDPLVHQFSGDAPESLTLQLVPLMP
nr:hypothetical protein [Tanacetum cinerariifolium]